MAYGKMKSAGRKPTMQQAQTPRRKPKAKANPRPKPKAKANSRRKPKAMARGRSRQGY